MRVHSMNCVLEASRGNMADRFWGQMPNFLWRKLRRVGFPPAENYDLHLNSYFGSTPSEIHVGSDQSFPSLRPGPEATLFNDIRPLLGLLLLLCCL